MNEKPLVNKQYLLEKLPGKYGWTYAIISEIKPDPNAPFNWVKVRGSIDGYEIKKYRLMPPGKGDPLPAVKSEIRQKTGERQAIMFTLFYIPTMNRRRDSKSTRKAFETSEIRRQITYRGKLF